MTTLVLVRHGITDQTGKRLYGRSRGVSLSERGREQAKHAADRLAELPVRAVYSSPLERCVETAEPIAERVGAELHTMEDLAEVDYGSLTGRTFAALSRLKVWQRLHRTPSIVRFPDGESLIEVQRRHVDAIERIATDHPDALVVVVTHGDPIALTLAHFAGVHIDLFQRVSVAPGSLSAVAIGDGDPRILRVNDTGSIADLAPPPRTRRRTRS